LIDKSWDQTPERRPPFAVIVQALLQLDAQIPGTDAIEYSAYARLIGITLKVGLNPPVYTFKVEYTPEAFGRFHVMFGDSFLLHIFYPENLWPGEGEDAMRRNRFVSTLLDGISQDRAIPKHIRSELHTLCFMGRLLRPDE
jgi:hypothetical protein